MKTNAKSRSIKGGFLATTIISSSPKAVITSIATCMADIGPIKEVDMGQVVKVVK